MTPRLPMFARTADPRQSPSNTVPRSKSLHAHHSIYLARWARSRFQACASRAGNVGTGRSRHKPPQQSGVMVWSAEHPCARAQTPSRPATTHLPAYCRDEAPYSARCQGVAATASAALPWSRKHRLDTHPPRAAHRAGRLCTPQGAAAQLARCLQHNGHADGHHQTRPPGSATPQGRGATSGEKRPQH